MSEEELRLAGAERVFPAPAPFLSNQGLREAPRDGRRMGWLKDRLRNGLARRLAHLDNGPMVDPVVRLLEMRLRFRRHPQARAYVDRALQIIAKSIAEDADLAELDREVRELAQNLAARFGPKAKAHVHSQPRERGRRVAPFPPFQRG